MSLLDPPKNENYPKQWKDMSLEFKLMFVYHGCMMLLLITGGAFSVRQELVFTCVLLFVLASISIRHRRLANWRWQGVKPKNLLMAIGIVGLIGFFLFSATPMFPPSNPRFLPWFLAGFGIGAFNVLQALQLVRPSEATFLADCHEPGIQPEQTGTTNSTEPQWHRAARAIYATLFFLVWSGFVAFFYYSGVAFRDGSSVPTQTQTEPITDHGKTVYITHNQKVLCDRLQLFAFVGIPLALAGGLALHFLVGVKLYPNTSTLHGFLTRKSPGS